jgi:hypothetical protein
VGHGLCNAVAGRSAGALHIKGPGNIVIHHIADASRVTD